jgi:hypothetical protein
MCDLAMVRSGSWTIVVGSLAVSLAVLSSPPPETFTELVTVAAAFGATLTVSTMTGKLSPAASTVLVVQVKVPRLQTQPAPDIAVADKPAGKVSTTVTVPLVCAMPELVTVIV